MTIKDLFCQAKWGVLIHPIGRDWLGRAKLSLGSSTCFLWKPLAGGNATVIEPPVPFGTPDFESGTMDDPRKKARSRSM
jgi:hypothetical protein